MAKYRKKPIAIDVICITADNRDEWPDEVKRTEAGYEVYNALHDSWIKFKSGDWINITDPKDRYPIDAATFAATYEAVE